MTFVDTRAMNDHLAERAGPPGLKTGRRPNHPPGQPLPLAPDGAVPGA